MKDGNRWLDVTQDHNCYTSIMRLGSCVLVRVAIYNMDLDHWDSLSVVNLSYQDVPKEWLDKYREAKQ